jgi:hypothetical protein
LAYQTSQQISHQQPITNQPQIRSLILCKSQQEQSAETKELVRTSKKQKIARKELSKTEANPMERAHRCSVNA